MTLTEREEMELEALLHAEERDALRTPNILKYCEACGVASVVGKFADMPIGEFRLMQMRNPESGPYILDDICPLHS